MATTWCPNRNITEAISPSPGNSPLQEGSWPNTTSGVDGSDANRPPQTASTLKAENSIGDLKGRFIDDFPTGTGARPDADIWPVYNKEAEKHDKEMFETYNGSMDSLLIVAALFSAVVTTFLVLTLPLLQPDSSQAIVDTLAVISSQLAVVSVNASVVPAAPLKPFVMPTSALYTNVLWLFSLLMSLSVSVSAMLVKQWLRTYNTELPSSPLEKAHHRQFRLEGMGKWHVTAIADCLPVLLHLSIDLFVIGLSVYLWTVNQFLAVVIWTLCGLLSLGYFLLAAAPLVWLSCPYTSPLTTLFDRMWRTLSHDDELEGRNTVWNRIAFSRFARQPQLIKQRIKEHGTELTKSALSWLYSSSSDVHVAKAVYKANFSLEDSVSLDVKRLKAMEERRVPSLSTLPLPSLKSSLLVSPVLPSTWAEMKELLKEVAYAKAFTFSAGAEQGLGQFHRWAQLFPLEDVPQDERLSFCALLLHCAGPRPRRDSLGLNTFTHDWVDYASHLLLKSIQEETTKVSSFGSALFLEYIRRVREHLPPGYEPLERLRQPLIAFVSASVSLPLVLLRLAICIWGTYDEQESCCLNMEWGQELLSGTTSPAMSEPDGFLLALIAAPTHSDLGRSIISYVINGMKKGSHWSISPRKATYSVLRWFKANNYLYPAPTSLISGPNPLVADANTVEAELLQLCVEKRGIYVLELETIDMSQLIDIEGQPNIVFQAGSNSEDAVLRASGEFFDKLRNIIQSGQHFKNPRVVTISTFLLQTISRVVKPGRAVIGSAWTKVIPDWIGLLATFGFKEVILPDSRQCRVLSDVLQFYAHDFNGADDAFSVISASNIIELFRQYEEHENLVQLPNFSIFLEKFAAEEACRNQQPPTALVPPVKPFRMGFATTAWILQAMLPLRGHTQVNDDEATRPIAHGNDFAMRENHKHAVRGGPLTNLEHRGGDRWGIVRHEQRYGRLRAADLV